MSGTHCRYQRNSVGKTVLVGRERGRVRGFKDAFRFNRDVLEVDRGLER